MRLTPRSRGRVERQLGDRNRTGPRSVLASMGDTKTTSTDLKRRLGYALAFAALCAVLVAVIGIPSADAINAKVIGQTKRSPKPSCPARNQADECSAIGSVTGFMTKADGKNHPFHVFKDGKIVAWAIDLSKPSKSERNVFAGLFENRAFGRHPSARISVLKAKSRRKYKLVKQSPALDLKRVLGRKQIFTLNKPLAVRRGQVIALTTSTWATAFALPVSSSENQWRASRRKSRCNVSKDHPANIKASRPQQKVGSLRPYACRYSGGRLLYWAYFVPNKK
jgi:hypothetical protein